MSWLADSASRTTSVGQSCRTKLTWDRFSCELHINVALRKLPLLVEGKGLVS